MNIVNIAAYKFVSLKESELPVLRADLKEKALESGIKGTILLSTEGINLFLAGEVEGIETFKQVLASNPHFGQLTYKESLSDEQPFSRMLVRLKKEIISMGCPEIRPESEAAPHLSPEELKEWYLQGKKMVILDTRNDYEVKLGTFDQAVDLNIKSFRDFPKVIENLPEEMKTLPIVTFCTGGIRCEKAAQLMLNRGFRNVYQLDGGILNYFEKVGGDHYHGECFVFDKRVAVNHRLEETATVQCYSCRNPLSADEQQNAAGTCPFCGENKFLKGD